MKIRVLASFLLLAAAPLAMADATQTYELTISNHRFTPAEITIPAQTRVKLVIHNQDDNFEEFHSDSLHQEKILAAKTTGIIKLGPLPAGTYSFMGEFHAETAQGRIIVK